MRIIRGKYSGMRLPEYKGSNTRPTSDLVKESLFNTLEAYVDFEGITVIDLFAGTGNIGLECLSRGASELISIDHNTANIRYMQTLKAKVDEPGWTIVKADAMSYVRSFSGKATLIFADPPYDYPHMHDLVGCVLNADWFKGETFFVLEHADRLVFHQKHVFLKKQYGNTSFTCFRPVDSIA